MAGNDSVPIKTKMKTKIPLVVVFACAACAPQYQATYDLSLAAVERPETARQQYGAQVLVNVNEDSAYRFEDELVRVVWTPTATNLGVRIENKTSHTIRVIWDNAAFVDKDGESQRVMHSGVRYIERDQPQPPSVIVRGGHIEDVIIPTEYVRPSSSLGWDEMSFFPITGSVAKADSTLAEYVGRRVQVLLPLEIQGVQNDYIFSFDIKRACYAPLKPDDLRPAQKGRQRRAPRPQDLTCIPAASR